MTTKELIKELSEYLYVEPSRKPVIDEIIQKLREYDDLRLQRYRLLALLDKMEKE